MVHDAHSSSQLENKQQKREYSAAEKETNDLSFLLVRIVYYVLFTFLLYLFLK
jgi:hypothetical protein